METYNISNALLRYRKSHHVSQRQVAAKLGVSQSFYSGLERAAKKVSLKSLRRHATSLGVSETELMQNARISGDTYISHKPTQRIELVVSDSGYSVNREGLTDAETITYLELALHFYKHTQNQSFPKILKDGTV